jgi:hypothetical protein
MKKIVVAFALFLFMLGAYINSNAQVVVGIGLRVRPAEPVVVETRPASPFVGAIWIGPEWRWNNNAYERVPGYWSKPHHGHWEAGGWEDHHKEGAYWRGGRWKNDHGKRK